MIISIIKCLKDIWLKLCNRLKCVCTSKCICDDESKKIEKPKHK